MALSTPVKVEKPGAAVVISIPTPQSSLKPASAKRRKITDFRLASALEDKRPIRELLRSGGRLVQWQNDDLVNVISLDALGLNSTVMCVVAEVHCSQSQVVKPPAINYMKAQVGCIKTHILFFIHFQSCNLELMIPLVWPWLMLHNAPEGVETSQHAWTQS